MVACCPGFTMVVHKTLSDMPFHLEPNSIMLHNKFQVGGRGSRCKLSVDVFAYNVLLCYHCIAIRKHIFVEF